jgi:single-strand DNA-binding protein
MNKVILIGRITKDLELKPVGETQNCKFTIAVDRRFTKGDEKQADFVSCIAWGNQAKFIANHFSKGRRIAVVGHIKTGSWTDAEAKKHYTTDVVIDEAEFADGKPSEKNGQVEEETQLPWGV